MLLMVVMDDVIDISRQFSAHWKPTRLDYRISFHGLPVSKKTSDAAHPSDGGGRRSNIDLTNQNVAWIFWVSYLIPHLRREFELPKQLSSQSRDGTWETNSHIGLIT
jgi:hypothetical protein